MVRKAGERVRIYTRRGVDWTRRLSAHCQQCAEVSGRELDGEGVICDDYGLASFHKLHSKLNDECVMLYAFDMLARSLGMTR